MVSVMIVRVPFQKKNTKECKGDGVREASGQDMSDDNTGAGVTRETYAWLFQKNVLEINRVLQPYNLDFVAYLNLTGGTPVDPLELPPKFMDRETWLKTTSTLNDEVQVERERHTQDGGRALNQALKNRWNHVFFTRPMNAEKFRRHLGALLDERFSLMCLAKSAEEYDTYTLVRP